MQSEVRAAFDKFCGLKGTLSVLDQVDFWYSGVILPHEQDSYRSL